MKHPISILGAVLLAASTALHAQAPQGGPAAKQRAQRFDCSKAKDPKACEERLAKAKAARDKARQACEGKQGDERRACMQKEVCAQAKDPAQCEARAKELAARREQVREACKGKQGEELRSCVREQRQKK